MQYHMNTMTKQNACGVLNTVTTFLKVAPPNGYFVMSTVSHTLATWQGCEAIFITVYIASVIILHGQALISLSQQVHI